MAATKEASKKGLVAKLASVMAQVKHIPKRGRNAFHGYDYATEADVSDAVRDAFASQGIIVLPAAREVVWQDAGKGKLCSMVVEVMFTDGEETVSVHVPAAGVDSPGDKAPYKALTGAIKYALMKMLLIPTGDDPERDDSDVSHPATPPRAAPKPATKGTLEPKARKEEALGQLMEMGLGIDGIRNFLKDVLGRTLPANAPITLNDLTELEKLEKAVAEAVKKGHPL